MNAVRMIMFISKGEKQTFVLADCITKEMSFLEKLIVSAGVSWNEKTDIFFVEARKTKLSAVFFAARMLPHLSSQ